MPEFFPKYYHKFSCIADRCLHSCCKGWEIDIDEDTMNMYNSLDTVIGAKIRENIEGDVPHFILKEDNRCPFLNKNGLCDIILECGAGGLCEICSEHPRFYNFFPSFTETGLGLCCEEAARIILSEHEKFFIQSPETSVLSDEEKEFLSLRNKIFEILQDREKSITERFALLADTFKVNFNYTADELCNIYLSLEILKKDWAFDIESLKNFLFDNKVFDEFSLVFEQLAVYFIFRHLIGAVYDGNYQEKVGFALISCRLIGMLCGFAKSNTGSISPDEIFDFARRYSEEIEYSEENTQVLMNMHNF